MKVALQENYKDMYTVNELTQARNLIACMKDDSSSVKDYAAMAAREALAYVAPTDYMRNILTATAETAKNGRLEYDQMGDGCGLFDVWIDFIAETSDGFIKGGAYLSDIYGVGAVNIRSHMFLHYYTER